MSNATARLVFHDCEPTVASMRDDVLDGLAKGQKELPCKYLYDERGSHLFDQICELDEYYPTKAELAIMQAHADEMADHIGPAAMLIEYGSGSSVKTRLLLDALRRPAAYVPIDISRDHLHRTAADLFALYPDLDVLPVCADFTGEFDLPQPLRPVQRRTVYFPGSTIGNFTPDGVDRLLQHIVRICEPGGSLLIGVDLKKDRSTLETAYDDSQGVTRQFTLNLLRRMNRELDADFDLSGFEHHAFYNDAAGRIECHLVSRRPQQVTVDGAQFAFRQGETIHIENSYKYDVAQFREFAAAAGLEPVAVWTDPADLFSVQYFTVEQ